MNADELMSNNDATHMPLLHGIALQCCVRETCTDSHALRAECRMHIGRTRKFREAQKRPLKACVRLPHACCSSAGWSKGTNLARKVAPGGVTSMGGGPQLSAN